MIPDDLKYAGAELRIAHLKAELDHLMGQTWRGRLILRLFRLQQRYRRRRAA